jgi:hypothetical protein
MKKSIFIGIVILVASLSVSGCISLDDTESTTLNDQSNDQQSTSSSSKSTSTKSSSSSSQSSSHVCSECGGTGTVTCYNSVTGGATCYGTGIVQGGSTEGHTCRVCGGTGTIICPTCNGNGYI